MTLKAPTEICQEFEKNAIDKSEFTMRLLTLLLLGIWFSQTGEFHNKTTNQTSTVLSQFWKGTEESFRGNPQGFRRRTVERHSEG